MIETEVDRLLLKKSGKEDGGIVYAFSGKEES